MAVVKINLSCELSEAVKVQYLHGNLFSQDNQANVINVAVFEDGEPVELAGTVTANVIRPDGGTVAVTGGTYSGNVATITMPSAVYAIPGAISVAVKITLDSVVTTIAAFAATVYATFTDTAVDPGTIIPSIQTLIAEIEAAVDSIPADYSSLWATLAPNYSNLTFPVAVGQYCTYDGGFYRCNTAIATQEAWTAAHWTATNIGADLAETRLDVANLEDDVSELKSAVVDLSEMLNAGSYTFEQGAVRTNINETYEQLKTESDTRVRTVTTIAVNPSLSYYISSLNKDQYFSVVKFNAVGVSYGSSDEWVTDEYTFTGANYIAIAVRNKDNSNIVPSDVYGIRVYLQNAVEVLSNEITELETQCDENTTKLNSMISISGIVPSFVVGAYVYIRSTDTMDLTTNAARLTADLRGLELAQGDSVGITDYTTYSIAFGDNSRDGGWYSGGYNTHDVTANNANIYPYVFLVKRNDNADISQTDIEAIKAQFHYTGGKEQINITEEFGEAINEVVADDGNKICNNNYLHFSFDDVAYCILNLVNNGASFNSLWDEPFFGMLKRLHDTYGAIFSLYIWDVANLANIPSKFKAEFMASSEWLKFGFHSYTEGSMAETSYNDAKTQYETFINYVFSKIGGVNSVDRIPRLNYFAGNVNALTALRDANCGCIGFLNTDDTRSTYYLTQDELTYLRTHSLWSDRTNGLQFVSTVMRLDWFVSGFSSQYDYNVPVEDNPYDELVYRYGQPAMADLYSELIVFTHEWQTYSSGYALNSAMVDRIEQVCRFANDYKYDFDYPQNRVENITSYAVGEIVIDNFTTTVHGEWSFGAVQDGGEIVSSETRIRTMPFKASKVVVSFPSGYKVNVCRYNSANADSTSFVDNTGWTANKQSLTGDYYYVIVASTMENTASLDIADLYAITAVRNINDL